MTMFRVYLGNNFRGPIYYWAPTKEAALEGAEVLAKEFDPPFEDAFVAEKVEFEGIQALCDLLNFQQSQIEQAEHKSFSEFDLQSRSLLP